MSRRLVFFGTAEYSAQVLEALHRAGHNIVLVVTQPDRRRGRRGNLSPTPVKAKAMELGLTVTQRMKDVLELQGDEAKRADIGVLVSFGRIIKPEILEVIEILNVHPSLLPRWRGATPVEAAILAGDTRTGVCIMRLGEEMDAGPVFSRKETDILPGETSTELYDRLFESGTRMLLDVLANPDRFEPQDQIGTPTFCGRFTPEDFRIDWNAAAVEIERLSRIGRPWTQFRGQRLLVLKVEVDSSATGGQPGALDGIRVATGDGIVLLREVQPEGKSKRSAQEWINGARLQPGERLGQ